MAHVLEGVAQEVYLLIYDEKPIMYLVGQLDALDGGALCVMLVEGVLDSLIEGGVDGAWDAIGALVKEGEGAVVAVIINEDDLLLGGADDGGHVGVGVPHTAGGEEALLWLLVDVNEELDLLLLILHLLLECNETGVYLLLECYEVAIDGIASEHVVFEHACCPLTEPYAHL